MFTTLTRHSKVVTWVLSLKHTHTDSLGPNSRVARPKHESPCEQWCYSEGSRWDGRHMKDVVRDPDWSWSRETMWTHTGNMFNSHNLHSFQLSFLLYFIFFFCLVFLSSHCIPAKTWGDVWLSNGILHGSVLSPLLFFYIHYKGVCA